MIISFEATLTVLCVLSVFLQPKRELETRSYSPPVPTLASKLHKERESEERRRSAMVASPPVPAVARLTEREGGVGEMGCTGEDGKEEGGRRRRRTCGAEKSPEHVAEAASTLHLPPITQHTSPGSKQSSLTVESLPPAPLSSEHYQALQHLAMIKQVCACACRHACMSV